MRVIKVLSALCVTILVMGGCDNWLRIPPTLRSPEDEAVFTEDSPTFAWGNQERIDSFHIVIWADSSLESLTLIDKLVTDTTYTIPSSIFEGLPRGKYFWKVANIMEGVELWSEVRFFQIDHDLPALDLDTTYYPLGLNYKWVYQNWIDNEIWDTSTVEVTEVENHSSLITFTLKTSGNVTYDLPTTTILIGNVLYCDRVDTVCGYLDTLHNSYSGKIDEVGTGPTYYSGHKTRVKGLGLLEQGIYYSYWDEPEETFEDRLLYFIKGADTVWRCEDCP